MSATLDLPLLLSLISPEQIAWLAAKSSQTGKPVNEVAIDLVRDAADRDGFGVGDKLQTGDVKP